MSAHATLPIERHFADVRRTGRRVPVAGGRNPGWLHSFREVHNAVGTELRTLVRGAEGARYR